MRRRSYSSYAPYSEAMRDASATKAPPVPRRVGAVCTEKLLEQLGCTITSHGWYVRADICESPAWEDMLHRRRGVKLLASRETREDYEG